MPWIVDVFSKEDGRNEELEFSKEFPTRAAAEHWLSKPNIGGVRNIFHGPYFSLKSREAGHQQEEPRPDRERLLEISRRLNAVETEVLYENGKYKPDNWLHSALEWLGFRACEEIVELVNSKDRSEEEQQREAADVRNFVHMICDVLDCFSLRDSKRISYLECDNCSASVNDPNSFEKWRGGVCGCGNGVYVEVLKGE